MRMHQWPADFVQRKDNFWQIVHQSHQNQLASAGGDWQLTCRFYSEFYETWCYINNSKHGDSYRSSAINTGYSRLEKSSSLAIRCANKSYHRNISCFKKKTCITLQQVSYTKQTIMFESLIEIWASNISFETKFEPLQMHYNASNQNIPEQDLCE